MDVNNKKTVLNDEASIYQHKEQLSEKEKWQRMSWKERVEYFKNYYLMKIVVTVIVVGALCSLLYTMLSPKPETVLSVAVISSVMDEETCQKVQTAFEEQIALDEETQQTLFDTGYNFHTDEVESLQKFAMYNAVGDLDITVMSQSVFDTYAPVGYFASVAEKLSTDLYVQLSDYLVECQKKDDNGNFIEGSETVYGIRIDSTWVYEGKTVEEPVIIAINIATSHEENIEKFLRLLFSTETGN